MYNFRLQNSKFKYLIDDITIDFWYSWNFASIDDIIRKHNLSVDLSKIKYNKKILNVIVSLAYNLLSLIPKFVHFYFGLNIDILLFEFHVENKLKHWTNKDKIWQ